MVFEKTKKYTQQLISKAQIQQNQIDIKPKIILGLSGGPDSIFLLHVLSTLHQESVVDVVAAHLDHEWRPESGQDRSFCHDACKKLDIPFVWDKAKSFEKKIKRNGSQEELGRKFRRTFFEQVLTEHKAHFIMLAHHLQDQQETFFLRLIRGATLSGLCSMNEIEWNYLRPLLHFSKQEIISYLDQQNISYLTDPSNISDKFLRNRIRNYLIPALLKCDDRFDQKFETTLEMLKQENSFLQKLTLEAFKKVFTCSSGASTYDGNLDKLQTLDPVLQRRLILHWLIEENVPFTPSTSFLNEILKFLLSPRGGSHSIGPKTTINKKQNRFWLNS